jgi:hypothetical protein
MYYLQLTQYIYNTRSQFNNCCVLTVYWVTIHNIRSKCLPASTHTWTRLMMDFHTFSKVLGQLWVVWHVSEMCSLSVHPFPVVAKYKRVFKCPPMIKCTGMGQHVCRHILIWTFSLALMWGTKAWSLSKDVSHTVYTHCIHTQCVHRLICQTSDYAFGYFESTTLHQNWCEYSKQQ